MKTFWSCFHLIMLVIAWKMEVWYCTHHIRCKGRLLIIPWTHKQHPWLPYYESYGVSVMSMVKCRCNVVQYNAIFHTALCWLKQNSFISQKTPHILPSWASYGVCIVKIWEKIDCILMVPHCILEKNYHYAATVYLCFAFSLILRSRQQSLWFSTTLYFVVIHSA